MRVCLAAGPRTRRWYNPASLMLIDLHTHTKYSGDNALDPNMFVQLAKARGLDAICVTEHDSVEASNPVVPLGRTAGLLVLQAVEVTTDRGHVLCYGFEDDAWSRFRGSYYTRLEDLRACAEGEGAVLIPAHPYRQWSRSAARDELHRMPFITAIEVANGLNSHRENTEAGRVAAALQLPGTGGSDSHYEDEVARMATYFEAEITTTRDLVAALRGGTYYPVVRNGASGFVPFDGDGPATTRKPA